MKLSTECRGGLVLEKRFNFASFTGSGRDNDPGSRLPFNLNIIKGQNTCLVQLPSRALLCSNQIFSGQSMIQL